MNDLTFPAAGLLALAYANTYGSDTGPYADTAGEMPLSVLATIAGDAPLTALTELVYRGRIGVQHSDGMGGLTVVIADCPGCGYPMCDTFGDDCPASRPESLCGVCGSTVGGECEFCPDPA